MSRRTWIRSGCFSCLALTSLVLGGCDSAPEDVSDRNSEQSSQDVASQGYAEQSLDNQFVPQSNDPGQLQYLQYPPPSAQQSFEANGYQNQSAQNSAMLSGEVNLVQQQNEGAAFEQPHLNSPQYQSRMAFSPDQVVIHSIQPFVNGDSASAVLNDPLNPGPSPANEKSKSTAAHQNSAAHQNPTEAMPSVSVPTTEPFEKAIPDQIAKAFQVQSRESDASTHQSNQKLLNSASKPDGELAASAQRSQAILLNAMQLAERGALHSARDEFLKSLQITIAALDKQKNTDAHQQAFQSGWNALEEAADFFAGSSQQPIKLKEIVERHSSHVIKSDQLSSITLNEAVESYLEYASKQLSYAGGDMLPAADALFGLAKTHQLTSTEKDANPALEIARAETLYRASLRIEPHHAMAANELGVLLGRQGKFKEAKESLQLAASITAHPSTWKNLAIIHQDLGEYQLAQLAERESKIAQNRWQKQAEATGQLIDGTVNIVDNKAFARSAPMYIDSQNQKTQPPQQTASRTASPTNPPARTAENSWYNPFTTKK